MIYESTRQQDLAQQLHAFLPHATQQVLQLAATLAERNGWRMYLVGGTVRDMLLGRVAGDLDVTIEGDAIVLAELLATTLGGNIIRHAAFGTALVELGGAVGRAEEAVRELPVHEPIAVDLVTARSERYQKPAVLPEVQPATLHEDLWRRDFAINAIAISLNATDYGRLYDPTGGLGDLQSRHVRVLHDQSFLDDPTRILRAVRLATRLDCVLEPHTLALVQYAIAQGMIQHTSPARVLQELLLVLDEAMPAAVFKQFQQLGILTAMHPALQWQPEMDGWFSTAQDVPLSQAERANLGIALLTWHMNPEQRVSFMSSFPLDRHGLRVLRDVGTLQRLLPQLSIANLACSVVDQTLSNIDSVALWAARIATTSVCSTNISLYLDELQHMHPALDGNDLRALGLQPGPQFRVLLAGLRAALLDGIITTRTEQEAWVRAQI